LAAVSCVPAWKSKRKAHPLSLSLSLSAPIITIHNVQSPCEHPPLTFFGT
jgi:hypothetical protein